MRSIIYIGWFALNIIFAISCNDNKNNPEPKLELKTVLAGKYWNSSESFIYIKDGEEFVDTKSSLAALHWDVDRRSFLGTFFLHADGSSIDRYTFTPYEGPSKERNVLLYRGYFNLLSDTDTNTIQLSANDPEIATENVYAGMFLTLHSLTQNRIEFNMEINDFVRKNWSDIFEQSSSSITITGIRVVWTLLTDQEKEDYHNFESPIIVFPENR